MEIMTIVLWILAVLLVVGGFAGLVFPVVPGSPLVFAGLVCAAWAEGFKHVGGWTIAVLAVLAVLAYIVDFLSGSYGARRFGSTRRAAVGAAVGGVVGIFFGLPGVLLGPFLGAVLGELSWKRDLNQAARAGIGAWIGLVLGTAAKFALCFTMVCVFILARFL